MPFLLFRELTGFLSNVCRSNRRPLAPPLGEHGGYRFPNEAFHSNFGSDRVGGDTALLPEVHRRPELNIVLGRLRRNILRRSHGASLLRRIVSMYVGGDLKNVAF